MSICCMTASNSKCGTSSLGLFSQGFSDSFPQNSVYLNLSSPPTALMSLKVRLIVFSEPQILFVATFQSQSDRCNLEAEILKC